MRLTKMHRLLLATAILLIPLPALAIPAITCHCFTDRTYDPARPALADPYFLATTQNSFFAALFNVDKKSVVLKKQKGTSADDLWVAYGVSSRSGIAPDALLEAKESKGSWKDVLSAFHVKPQSLGASVAAALHSGDSTQRLAEGVVNDTIIGYRLLDEKELSVLRKAGATNQEVFLATLLAARTKQPARQILASAKSGKSWGRLLKEAGLDPGEIQQAAFVLVHPSR